MRESEDLVTAGKANLQRCAWAQKEPLIAYHDAEWGVPLHDDRKLFEFLILEGAQAGLSWETILKRRDGYRQAFDGFDPRKVARYDAAKTAALLLDAGIIRNRQKIAAAVTNAQAFLRVQKEFGSFDRYLWQWGRESPADTVDAGPARVTRTAGSDALSKDLRARGFSFVGTTIIYALMQAVGMVNDHDQACFRRREIGSKAARCPSLRVRKMV
jgi:DNA-3-methyladenine glycosylase I